VFLLPALFGTLLAAGTPAAPIDRALDQPPAGGGAGEKYIGVMPGANARNPLPSPKKGVPMLIWSGFQMNEQGSRVFFQTSAPVEFEVREGPTGKGKATGKTLSVFLKNCRIHLKNNSRRLDTRFFATPVLGVSAKQNRKDVELRIALKELSNPAPRTEAGPDGTTFLVLEFPIGQPAADRSAVESKGDNGGGSLEPPPQR
jgi:hypothetical protein